MPRYSPRKAAKEARERAAFLKGKRIYHVDPVTGLEKLYKTDPGFPLDQMTIVDPVKVRQDRLKFEAVMQKLTEKKAKEHARKKQKKQQNPEPLPAAQEEFDRADLDEDNMSAGEEAGMEVPAIPIERVHRQKTFWDFWDSNKSHMVDRYLKSLGARGPPLESETTPRLVECHFGRSDEDSSSCGCSRQETTTINVFYMHSKYIMDKRINALINMSCATYLQTIAFQKVNVQHCTRFPLLDRLTMMQLVPASAVLKNGSNAVHMRLLDFLRQAKLSAQVSITAWVSILNSRIKLLEEVSIVAIDSNT